MSHSPSCIGSLRDEQRRWYEMSGGQCVSPRNARLAACFLDTLEDTEPRARKSRQSFDGVVIQTYCCISHPVDEGRHDSTARMCS